MTAHTMSTAEAVDYINARTATTGRRRRIGADTLRSWAAAGRAPAARNGANWIYTDTALDQWLATGLADWSQRNAA
jgi:hypothetical protein